MVEAEKEADVDVFFFAENQFEHFGKWRHKSRKWKLNLCFQQ